MLISSLGAPSQFVEFETGSFRDQWEAPSVVQIAANEKKGRRQQQ
jgi:hypothetical protein